MDLWSLFYHLSLLVLLKSKPTLFLASLWNISAFIPIYSYEPMVFQSVSKLVEWSMKRALHVLFIYLFYYSHFWYSVLAVSSVTGGANVPAMNDLLAPFEIVFGRRDTQWWFFYWPNQGRREGDLFLTGHDVAPLDCYVGNNRVQMKIPRVLCADGICVFLCSVCCGHSLLARDACMHGHMEHFIFHFLKNPSFIPIS